jgi:hypothetical protein
MLHVLDMSYSAHCVSCPEALKVVRQFAAERPDVVLVEHDVEADLELAKSYGLIATPAVVIDRESVLYGVPRPATLAARMDGQQQVHV